MENFQLYKQRKFNDYLNDIIQFFRVFGKDYFKKFFMVNGGVLLVQIIFMLFYIKSGDPNGSFAMIVFSIILAGIVFIFSAGFPNAYFTFLKDDEQSSTNASDILKNIGDNSGKMVVFMLISLFAFILGFVLLAIIVSLIAIAFHLIIITYIILVAPIIFGVLWMFLSLVIYLQDEYTGYFESVGKAWNIIFGNFWAIFGSFSILLIIIYAFQLIFGFIDGLLLGVLYASTGSAAMENSTFIYTLIYIVSMITGSILFNSIYVQLYLVYFSSVEKEENIHTLSELDTIGQNNEE